MCSDNFWKRLVAFCLTFWLGVFISGLFVSKPTTAAETESKALVEKNCVPADKNLKYHLLSEEAAKTQVKKNEKIETETPKNKEPRAVKGIQNSLDEIEKQLYRPSKDEFKNKNLLHKENCYEYSEQK